MTAATAARPPAGTDTIAVLDPATGAEIGTIPAGDAGTVDAAVRAARAAQVHADDGAVRRHGQLAAAPRHDHALQREPLAMADDGQPRRRERVVGQLAGIEAHAVADPCLPGLRDVHQLDGAGRVGDPELDGREPFRGPGQPEDICRSASTPPSTRRSTCAS
jgi:hypothetical protein